MDLVGPDFLACASFRAFIFFRFCFLGLCRFQSGGKFGISERLVHTTMKAGFHQTRSNEVGSTYLVWQPFENQLDMIFRGVAWCATYGQMIGTVISPPPLPMASGS